MKEELKKLQDELATIDLFSSGENNSDFTGFKIKQFRAIKIKMYPENHNLPHIHIDYGKEVHTGSYSIENCKRLAGNLDRKYDKKLKGWIEENKAKLLEIWDQIQKGNYPQNLIEELPERFGR